MGSSPILKKTQGVTVSSEDLGIPLSSEYWARKLYCDATASIRIGMNYGQQTISPAFEDKPILPTNHEMTVI